MNTRTLTLLALCGTLLTTALSAHADERILRRHQRDGDSAARVVAADGDKGELLRGRRTHVDEEGNVVTGRGALLRGAEGGKAVRASRTVRSPDGSLNREAGFAASGSQGTIKSQGNLTRSADGDVNAQRQTSATGTQGNTYQGSTTYSKGEGFEHTGSCADAAGNTIDCKR